MVTHGHFLHRGGMLAFAVLSVTALLFGIGHQFHVSRTLTLEKAEQSLSNLASALEASTTRTVQSVDVTLASIADALGSSGLPRDGQARDETVALLLERLRRSPHLRALTLLDPAGTLVATTEDSRLSGRHAFAGRELFRSLAPGTAPGLVIGRPVRGRNLVAAGPGEDRSGKWILPMSRAVPDADGALLGVIVASVNPEYFQALFQTVEIGRQGSVTLFRYDGVPLAGLPLAPERIGVSAAGSELFRNRLPAAEHGVFREPGPDGGTRLTAFRVTPVWPLVLAISRSEEEELAGWRTSLHDAALIVGGFVLVILLFTVTLMRSAALVQRQGAALAEGHARLNAILEAAVEGILTARPDGTIESANPAAHRIFGRPPGTLAGRAIRDLVPPFQQESHARHLADILRGDRRLGPGFTREVNAMRADGSVFPLDISVAEVKTRHGPLFAAIIRDLTERKRVERALHEAKEKAEAGQRSKMDFLATVSHEIRTPMNGVIGMAGLLLETPMDEEQRTYAATIRESAESLLVIINDILDFSKIDAGRLDLEVNEFDPVPLVESVVELLAPRAVAKGLELISYVPPSLRGPLRGDPGRIRQILINLAGNAVKFTDHGSVTIVLSEEEPAGRGRAEVRIEVRDTGIGISAADRARLFTMFTQVDASAARRHGGTGLGLAIAKRLTELMGGRIGVESAPGAGSVFWVCLPLDRGALPAAAGLAPADWSGRRVLLVDDSAVSRDLLVRHLEGFGIAAESAATGPEALERLRAAAAAGRPFDAAILDHDMPGMTGPELAARIRAQPALAGLRLALAAAQRAEERAEKRQERAAVFDALIVKPIRSNTLRAGLARLLDGPPEPPFHHGAAGAGWSAGPAQARRCRVLVAEDNPVSQQLTLALLRRAGHLADAVSNGEEAVNAVAALPYDLVLMDVQMPVMDGLAATRSIRRLGGPAGRVPIVAMTANAMHGDDAACLAAGMDDYLPKPLGPEQLLGAVDRWGPPPVPRDPPSLPSPPARRADLLEALGEEGFAHLMQTFFRDLPGHMERLHAAARAGDAATVGHEAHIIKGAAGNLGFQPLADAANRVMTAARRHDRGEDGGEDGGEGIAPAVAALARSIAGVERERAAVSEGAGPVPGTDS